MLQTEPIRAPRYPRHPVSNHAAGEYDRAMYRAVAVAVAVVLAAGAVVILAGQSGGYRERPARRRAWVPVGSCPSTAVRRGGLPVAARDAGIPTWGPWVADHRTAITGTLFYRPAGARAERERGDRSPTARPGTASRPRSCGGWTARIAHAPDRRPPPGRAGIVPPVDPGALARPQRHLPVDRRRARGRLLDVRRPQRLHVGVGHVPGRPDGRLSTRSPAAWFRRLGVVGRGFGR